MDSLMQLTRFQDRLTYLYLEKGHIEQDAKSVAYVTEKKRVPVPAADLALLMLGPGTTITHKAICNLGDCNCTVVWVGEEGVRFYCHGRGGTHFSANLLQQASLAANQRTRRQVVVRMYEKRFGESVEPGLHIQAIRGKEGYRVRSAYQKLAVEHGVQWTGRNYDAQNWNRGDPLNRALSAASACLNGIVHSGVVSAGYSAALGFVHTGKMLSFVYDVADLYKVDLIVPLVFQTVAESDQNVERRARQACRDMFRKTRFLEQLLPDIREVLHGGDDSGKGADEPAGRSEPLDDRAEGRDIPWQHDREDS
ncbi:MAG: type I-E CRISPR-associated endonuclease Cas1e [Planctomycetota bacterium]|nr:type I-E CRISPR-associated endonuclease Cas1e [Planctomycetota bacterium]